MGLSHELSPHGVRKNCKTLLYMLSTDSIAVQEG
jgi:hypothetical protein